MMTLRASLADYDLVMLRAIAERRGEEAPAQRSPAALQKLAQVLLSPASLAIALQDLDDNERLALDSLLREGGVMPALRFFHRFGEIRAAGPARLEREAFWKQPINAAEGLWYRGLIYKGFKELEGELVELIYLPDDVLPLLPAPPDIEPVLKILVCETPGRLLPRAYQVREELIAILLEAREMPLKSGRNGFPVLKPHPPAAGSSYNADPVSVRERQRFAFRLAIGLGLLRRSRQVWRPDTARLGIWLRLSYPRQCWDALQAWRDDSSWNDLWHIPGLRPQPTGWRNYPLHERKNFLNLLKQAPEGWLSLADFIAAVRSAEPAFLRRHGNFSDWQILDNKGLPVTGLENWDKVEGAFIRHLVCELLYQLGAVELGLAGEGQRAEFFRINAIGRAFLLDDAMQLPAEEIQPVVIDDRLRVTIPAAAGLYERFQVMRMGELSGGQNGENIYRLTAPRIGALRQRGVTLEQITAFLQRASGAPLPPLVEQAFKAWEHRRAGVAFSRALLLITKEEGLMDELYRQAEIKSLLGERLGPKSAVVTAANFKKLNALLQQEGYLV